MLGSLPDGWLHTLCATLNLERSGSWAWLAPSRASLCLSMGLTVRVCVCTFWCVPTHLPNSNRHPFFFPPNADDLSSSFSSSTPANKWDGKEKFTIGSVFRVHRVSGNVLCATLTHCDKKKNQWKPRRACEALKDNTELWLDLSSKVKVRYEIPPNPHTALIQICRGRNCSLVTGSRSGRPGEASLDVKRPEEKATVWRRGTPRDEEAERKLLFRSAAVFFLLSEWVWVCVQYRPNHPNTHAHTHQQQQQQLQTGLNRRQRHSALPPAAQWRPFWIQSAQLAQSLWPERKSSTHTHTHTDSKSLPLFSTEGHFKTREINTDSH